MYQLLDRLANVFLITNARDRRDARQHKRGEGPDIGGGGATRGDEIFTSAINLISHSIVILSIFTLNKRSSDYGKASESEAYSALTANSLPTRCQKLPLMDIWNKTAIEYERR